MSRIFGDRSQVEQWFANNHPLNGPRFAEALTEAEAVPGPNWIRLTSRFSVRVYRGVWEVDGIRLREATTEQERSGRICRQGLETPQ